MHACNLSLSLTCMHARTHQNIYNRYTTHLTRFYATSCLLFVAAVFPPHAVFKYRMGTSQMQSAMIRLEPQYQVSASTTLTKATTTWRLAMWATAVRGRRRTRPSWHFKSRSSETAASWTHGHLGKIRHWVDSWTICYSRKTTVTSPIRR